jgi:hypothetical protein
MPDLGWNILRERAEGAGLETDGVPRTLSQGEREDAERRFGKDALGLWTRHGSLAELVDEVVAGFEDPYESARFRDLWFEYVDWHAQSLARATGMANRSHRAERLDDETGGLLVSLGPSSSYLMQALELSASAYTAAVSTVQEEHVPALADEVRDAYGVLWRASKDPQVLENLAYDDPCHVTRKEQYGENATAGLLIWVQPRMRQ